MTKHNPIICALDTPNIDEAITLSQALQPHVFGMKLGLEFFVSHGPDGVREISKLGVPIFLDLKLHDIPNTVAGAVRAATRLGVSMLTIHTQGGKDMMRAALDASKEEAAKLGTIAPLILGVSVLTSLDDNDLINMGCAHTVSDQVLRLVQLAESVGLEGIVCSPQEIELIRTQCDSNLTLVTPGIRPASHDDDQKRVMTPHDAINAGADYLVVGRPITQAKEPAKVAAELLD